MRISRAFVAPLVFVTALVACEQRKDFSEIRVEASPQVQVDLRKQLISAIESSDAKKFANVVNEIKKSRLLNLLAPLFQNIWSGGCSDCRSFSRDFILGKYVRIEVADVLVHAVVNRITNDELIEYLEYAKSLLDDGDDYIVGRALYIVGLAGERSDVDLIIKEMLKEKDGTFRAAVVAFSQSCKINNSDYLSVHAKLDNENYKKFMEDVWSNAKDQRSRWCNR